MWGEGGEYVARQSIGETKCVEAHVCGKEKCGKADECKEMRCGEAEV